MPITARWDIISYCNLRCIHCRSEEFYDGDKQVYPKLEDSISTVDELKERGVTSLNILGGEPFAYRHILDVIEYASSSEIDVFITTNGIFLNDSKIDRLLSIGIKQLTISLDGSCADVNDKIRGKGVFDKSSAALRAVIAANNDHAGPGIDNVSVNTVLTKINMHDIVPMVMFCSELGVNSFRISPLDEIGNARDYTKMLYVSPSEQLDVAENVVEIIPSYPDLQISILDLKPLVLEYLYEKTGVPLAVGPVGCSACTKEIYVQPAGFVSPCLATAKQSELVKKERIPNYVSNIREMPSFDAEGAFSDFTERFSIGTSRYSNYKPCSTCAYAGTLCKPCPLGSASGQEVLEGICFEAEKRMSKLRSIELRSVEDAALGAQ